MTAPLDPTVSLVHLGCARNLIDSELILGRLADRGLIVSGDPSGAEAVILNTCSFIGPAREESHAVLRGLLEQKRAGEIGHVVVAGCLVQRARRQLAEQYPDVDLFAEISDYRRLADSVRNLVDGVPLEQTYLESPGLRPPERDGARLLSTPGSYAYLRISHGCDHSCSFCAIPGIRGPHRSKRLEDLLAEARELLGAGIRELVLVAEDSTAWGREMGLELPDLVQALADLEGVQRVRVMYAYPNRFPWRLTELLRDHPRVVPYLDIPIQHAATPILRGMKRAGDGRQVSRTLARLYQEVPGITLRTTFLIGFPGETEQHVDQVVELIQEFGLSRMGAFAYSPEEGTGAFDLAGAPPLKVVEERMARVLEARDENLRACQARRIGQVEDVLVDEGPDEHGFVFGRGAQDAPEVDLGIRVQAPGCAVGETVSVQLTGAGDTMDMLGHLS